MASRKRLLSLALLIVALLLVGRPGVVHAANTWTVCSSGCDYTSIQDAIDNASTIPGDTIQVQDGTYNENVTINKNDLVVESLSGVASTFITGQVRYAGNLTAGILDGFDITVTMAGGAVSLTPTGSDSLSGITIQNCDIHSNGISGGIVLDGVSTSGSVGVITITGNEIYGNTGAGVALWDGVQGTVTLENNTIRNNAVAGVNISYIGDTTTVRTVAIQNNNQIYSNSKAGIRNDIASALTISGNTIYSNGTAGIRNDAGDAGSIITGNEIYSNTYSGINIQDACTLELTLNDIHDNVRGGVHTGSDIANDFFDDSTGFKGSKGSAVLDIRKNKVYGNGQSGYGGGIDVRHGSGIINNNLVYENSRGGIRFGWESLQSLHFTEIINNTVVNNGNYAEQLGGGIIYDNLAGAVNDPPEGLVPAPPGELLIRNNISVYNEMAGIRACFQVYDNSMEERDYNLLYYNHYVANNGGINAPDCGWGNNSPIMSCTNQQFGGCGAYWDPFPYMALTEPNDILAHPWFVSMMADDYRLRTNPPYTEQSPAVDAGDPDLDGDGITWETDPDDRDTDGTRIDMGAYGGPDPIPYPFP